MKNGEQAMRNPVVLRLAFWLLVLLVGAWLVRDFHWEIVRRALPFLLRGLALSWELAILATLVGLIAGILLAAARLYGQAGLRHAAVAYIELIRAIPQIMIIFWIYFSVPPLTGMALDPWTAALIALSIIASAYLAEVVRAGLMSVPPVQREGAYSAGLAVHDSFLLVVLPQAFRNMLPSLIAHIIMIFKVTSLVYLIGLVDFFRATMLVNHRDYAPGPLYLTMAMVYFCCNYLLSLLIRRFDPKYTLAA